MTIADLKKRFDDALAIGSYGVAATPEHGLPGKEWCPYCGKYWRKWAGSTLQGHAACVVPALFKLELRALFKRTPSLTYVAAAKILGVSEAVVRSWASPTRGA